MGYKYKKILINRCLFFISYIYRLFHFLHKFYRYQLFNEYLQSVISLNNKKARLIDDQ